MVFYFNVKNKYFDNVVEGVSFQYYDGVILTYLKDSDPLKKKLMADEDFIDYVVKSDKLEYLPKTVTDVFLF